MKQPLWVMLVLGHTAMIREVAILTTDMPAISSAAGDALQKLCETVATLRAPNGCPWDREQTHHSLKRYLIEESYEVLQAIDDGDPSEICEELGDLMFQVVLHAQIASEAGHFDLQNVIDRIDRKMILRHPHVFANTAGDKLTSGAVVEQWEKIKASERSPDRSPFAGIPKDLPALARALKTLKKVSHLGVELQELKEMSCISDVCDRETLGLHLLSLVERCRRIKLDPEDTLRTATTILQENISKAKPSTNNDD